MAAKDLHKPVIWDARRVDAMPAHPDVLLSSYFDKEAGFQTRRPGGAGNWLLTFTVGGEGCFRQPGLDLRVRAGDVLLVEPTAYSHYGTTGRRWQVHWVHFLPLPGWEEHLLLQRVGAGLHHAHVASPVVRGRLVAAFQRLHGDLVRRAHLADALALTALAEILLVINRERPAQPVLDSRIVQALELMQRQLRSSHTVPSLARAVALSPSRFAHLFRAQVGQSVVQALQHLRLQQARRLLAETVEPVRLIGAAVGFPAPHYFARRFRAHTGLSPRAYRRRVQDAAARRTEA